ncbi:MAG: DUF4388 domain-containing protein [Deltaproteobacteria bacterium]|nr:DUF4388 domain-containing protein [Deltaproteobacteria bacterium]
MADADDLLTIGSDGTVRLRSVASARELSPHAGHYRLALTLPGLVVLARTDEAPEVERSRVMMAGEIISRMTMMEVLNVIATAHWRGELTVVGPDATRTLSLDQGALKHALSDATDDRLGQVLFRAGVLDQDELDALLPRVTDTQRLGQLLVKEGLVDQARLFELLRSQAEHIFFASLLVSSGHYVFAQPPADAEADAATTTIHVPVQGLLMEGVQRVDEMALFRGRIPDDSMIPSLVPDAPEAKKLEPLHHALLATIDGRRNIDQIARTTGLGSFQTVKGLYHLLQKKQITLRADLHVDPARVKELVSSFNEVMQDIFFAVATYGGVAQTRSTLEAWLEGSGYAPFFGPGVDEFGCVDAQAITDAIVGVEAGNPLAALHQALHEMAAFALFSATTTLPRDQELSLARDVNRRLERIRLND